MHGDDSERVWRRVHRLAGALNDGAVPGVRSAIPTYDAILIDFDPVVTDHVGVEHEVHALDARLRRGAAAPARTPRTWRIPTCFEGEHAPDLPWLAEHLDTTAEAIVNSVCGTELTLRCLGGPAAAAMLDGPVLPGPVPRLQDPRLRVPAGAVSLAGRQAVIGPVAAPSGWRQIGRTPVYLLGRTVDEGVPYAAGDRVRFVRLRPDEFDKCDGWLLQEVSA
ncbi:5-oxoprolinase subunit B family protein [Kineococcus sp. G2]|uniref:5-oxoprolinase subunit B family protein n=1 Tax=Kineococcus sp. G2 TaxID=3127484 RepID=UPI00301C8E1B